MICTACVVALSIMAAWLTITAGILVILWNGLKRGPINAR